jgi:hypothetical protein
LVVEELSLLFEQVALGFFWVLHGHVVREGKWHEFRLLFGEDFGL